MEGGILSGIYDNILKFLYLGKIFHIENLSQINIVTKILLQNFH